MYSDEPPQPLGLDMIPGVTLLDPSTGDILFCEKDRLAGFDVSGMYVLRRYCAVRGNVDSLGS